MQLKLIPKLQRKIKVNTIVVCLKLKYYEFIIIVLRDCCNNLDLFYLKSFYFYRVISKHWCAKL